MGVWGLRGVGGRCFIFFGCFVSPSTAGFQKRNPHHHRGPAGPAHGPTRKKPERWARGPPRLSRGWARSSPGSSGSPRTAGRAELLGVHHPAPSPGRERGAGLSPPLAPPGARRAPGSRCSRGRGRPAVPGEARGSRRAATRSGAERLTVADARLLSASVRWCGSQRLRNFEVRILLRKVRGCRMTQTWMSPSCSSLYLMPLHRRRARRQGTAPIFVPSGAGTSPPSSGLVSSICRGSPPPPELPVRSMAGRAGEGAGGGERGCPGCGAAGPPVGGPHPPTAQEGGGVGGRGRPQGRGRRAAAGAAARSFLRGSASS